LFVYFLQVPLYLIKLLAVFCNVSFLAADIALDHEDAIVGATGQLSLDLVEQLQGHLGDLGSHLQEVVSP
jgi:hypothetical protein